MTTHLSTAFEVVHDEELEDDNTEDGKNYKYHRTDDKEEGYKELHLLHPRARHPLEGSRHRILRGGTL